MRGIWSFRNLKFQYMLLLRGATKRTTAACCVLWVQYMLLLRGATIVELVSRAGIVVSIHAPLARSNHINKIFTTHQTVSIHAPLARSNIVALAIVYIVSSFNTCSSCEEQLKGGLGGD